MISQFKKEALIKEFPFLKKLEIVYLRNHYIGHEKPAIDKTNLKNYEIYIRKIDKNFLQSNPVTHAFNRKIRIFLYKPEPKSTTNMWEILMNSAENFIDYNYVNSYIDGYSFQIEKDTTIIEWFISNDGNKEDIITINKPNPSIDFEKLIQNEKKRAENELQKEIEDKNISKPKPINTFSSRHSLKQIVKFNDFKHSMTATIKNIIFTDCGKVLYDLNVWLDADGLDTTVIERVDSAFVFLP